MLHPIKSYFTFLLKSTNEHGVHSPFVFGLVTQCFYDKTNYPEYQTLKNYRRSLLQNRETIEVTDFGAGSKIFKSNKRQISKIARTAGITAKNAELLFRVVRYFKPQSILEIGTSLGLATSALSIGNPTAKVMTLEGCPQTSATAQSQFQRFGFNNIENRVSEFQSALDSFDIRLSTFDLIYFDGNHQKDATLKYFELLLPTATNDSVWIFDDIHWSPDMEQAWETIKKNPHVTVTVDTFQWGFVFFRKEQEKQDFVIRA
ncbi:O-methyltransferase [Flavobacterium caeni]|uniref:Methyltransferase domain-containing protein n=1 Tax=Flavobacterium caeni TaxID=490189 RepID=A0A1G5ALP8_9FLAO|nr:class I SAM-dependent methyltransferase [Flavobacterium caeni]SCX78801.1 Methyltransferase domain-containing protein [Flavobacterium caeni]